MRVGRGLYIPAEAGITEEHSLAEAARRVPNGVLCLLTALQFHGMTTQLPYQVWVAIDPKAWLPKPASPPLRIVRFSGIALNFGVEHHMIEKCWWQCATGPQWRTTRTTLPLVDGSGNITRLAG